LWQAINDALRTQLRVAEERHRLVDSMGLLLVVVVHAASIQDRDGAKLVLEKVPGHLTRLARIWADGVYVGQLIP
jgi:putative transposase